MWSFIGRATWTWANWPGQNGRDEVRLSYIASVLLCCVGRRHVELRWIVPPWNINREALDRVVHVRSVVTSAIRNGNRDHSTLTGQVVHVQSRLIRQLACHQVDAGCYQEGIRVERQLHTQRLQQILIERRAWTLAKIGYEVDVLQSEILSRSNRGWNRKLWRIVDFRWQNREGSGAELFTFKPPVGPSSMAITSTSAGGNGVD